MQPYEKYFSLINHWNMFWHIYYINIEERSIRLNVILSFLMLFLPTGNLSIIRKEKNIRKLYLIVCLIIYFKLVCNVNRNIKWNLVQVVTCVHMPLPPWYRFVYLSLLDLIVICFIYIFNLYWTSCRLQMGAVEVVAWFCGTIQAMISLG